MRAVDGAGNGLGSMKSAPVGGEGDQGKCASHTGRCLGPRRSGARDASRLREPACTQEMASPRPFPTPRKLIFRLINAARTLCHCINSASTVSPSGQKKKAVHPNYGLGCLHSFLRRKRRRKKGEGEERKRGREKEKRKEKEKGERKMKKRKERKKRRMKGGREKGRREERRR